MPIDVVYTWVNGSDPLLMRTLAEFKHSLEVKKNLTEAAKRTKQNIEKLKAANASGQSNTQQVQHRQPVTDPS